MSTKSTVRHDDGVREETTHFAAETGLSFNAVMNNLARISNAEKGFSSPVRLTTAQKSVFDLSSDEFDAACKKAVAARNSKPVTDHVTRFDAASGKVMKQYADGRVEYVLD